MEPDFCLKFDIKSAIHLNSIKFTPKVESSVLNPMDVLKKPQVKPFLNCKTKCRTPFVESTSTVDTDFHKKFDIKSANHWNQMKFTLQVESSVLNSMALFSKLQV